MQVRVLTYVATAITANLLSSAAVAADDRVFLAPLSDKGWYRNYAAIRSTDGRLHTGKDFDNGVTTAISAAGSGRVAAIYTNGTGDHGLGNTVILAHPVAGPVSSSLLYTLYGHLSSIKAGLTVGSYVSRGQTLGVMGKTGTGSANIVHLHFEFKTTNTLSSVDNLYWGYIPNTSQDNYVELANEGYRNPNDFFGNFQYKYSDFQLTNGITPLVYRNKPFSFIAKINNPFTSSGKADFRLVLETGTAQVIGVIGEVSGFNFLASGINSITFSKLGLSTPAGSYYLRLQYRGTAAGGDWQTLPTLSGGANPSLFTIF